MCHIAIRVDRGRTNLPGLGAIETLAIYPSTPLLWTKLTSELGVRACVLGAFLILMYAVDRVVRERKTSGMVQSR